MSRNTFSVLSSILGVLRYPGCCCSAAAGDSSQGIGYPEGYLGKLEAWNKPHLCFMKYKQFYWKQFPESAKCKGFFKKNF